VTELAADSTKAIEDVARTDTVRLAAHGDEAAFHRLVMQYHAPMSRVAFVICGDSEATRDAVQSAWAIAWRRLATVREPNRIESWLVAIAANEARQSVRKRILRPVVDISDAMEQVAAGASHDLAEVVDLQRALSRLKPEDRQVLALRFVAGYDSSEIARLIGGSPSGVRMRLSRLIERLRKDLANG